MCEGGGEGEFLKGVKKELLKGRLIGPCRGSKIPCTEALDVTPLNPYCKRKDAKPQTRRKPLGASGPESQTPKSPETLRKTLKPYRSTTYHEPKLLLQPRQLKLFRVIDCGLLVLYSTSLKEAGFWVLTYVHQNLQGLGNLNSRP